MEEKKSNSAKWYYPYGGPRKERTDFVNNSAGGGSGNGRSDSVNNKVVGGSSFATPVESNGITMATAPLSCTKKLPHESDNSNSDKEAPLTSVIQNSGISSDHLNLVSKDAESISSSGWIDVCKKKGKKNALQPT
jgi:hypothetical protein